MNNKGTVSVNQYRISKYNPIYRVNGRYNHDEWTSVSDVGKPFDGKILTLATYKKVESDYINAILDLLRAAQVKTMRISELEDCSNKCSFQMGRDLDADAIEKTARECLQELYWCKLLTADFFINFGYDYYVYIGCKLDYQCVNEIAQKHSLFCEEKVSPYCE